MRHTRKRATAAVKVTSIIFDLPSRLPRGGDPTRPGRVSGGSLSGVGQVRGRDLAEEEARPRSAHGLPDGTGPAGRVGEDYGLFADRPDLPPAVLVYPGDHLRYHAADATVEGSPKGADQHAQAS